MITAIVMIDCETGKVHEVAETLVDLDGVAEVYSITGEHDILALVRVSKFDDLAAVVSEKVAGLEGVTRTMTQMAFRCYSKHNMEKMWAEFIGE